MRGVAAKSRVRFFISSLRFTVPFQLTLSPTNLEMITHVQIEQRVISKLSKIASNASEYGLKENKKLIQMQIFLCFMFTFLCLRVDVTVLGRGQCNINFEFLNSTWTENRRQCHESLFMGWKWIYTSKLTTLKTFDEKSFVTINMKIFEIAKSTKQKRTTLMDKHNAKCSNFIHCIIFN